MLLKPVLKIEKFFIRLVGTRGSVLLILGAIWIVLGIGFLTSPMERFSRPGPGGPLDFLDTTPFTYVFSSMWIVGGIIAMVVAFLRVKNCEDDWGFNGIAIPPFLWGAAFWWAWALHIIFDGEFGRPSAYIGGLLYVTITLLIVFLSHHVQDHPEGPCFGRRISDSD